MKLMTTSAFTSRLALAARMPFHRAALELIPNRFSHPFILLGGLGIWLIGRGIVLWLIERRLG